MAGRAAGRHVEIALRNAEVVNAMGMLKGRQALGRA